MFNTDKPEPFNKTYVSSEIVEKVDDPTKSSTSAPVDQDQTQLSRRLSIAIAASKKAGNNIPSTCKSAYNTPLNVGETVNALSPDGNMIQSKILYYSPGVRRQGRLSMCDLRVEAINTPGYEFLVSSFHVEPIAGKPTVLPPPAAPTPTPVADVGLVGACGIIGATNSCYLNATTQLLYRIPELRTKVLSLDPEQDVIKTGPGTVLCDITKVKTIHRSLNEMFSALSSSRGNAINIQNINGINSYTNILRAVNLPQGTQEDASEYLSQIFGNLIDCSPQFDTVKEKVSIQSKSLLTIPNKELKNLGQPEEPGPRVSAETLYKIELDVPKSGNISIPDILQNFSKKETLTDYLLEFQNNGETVRANVSAEKQLQLSLTDKTENVIIVLKRFSFDRSSKKITSSISNLTTPITIDNRKFVIQGVITHIGETPKSGHYVYHEYRDDKTWKTFDDSTVIDGLKGIGASTVPDKGYILVYKKVSPRAGGRTLRNRLSRNTTRRRMVGGAVEVLDMTKAYAVIKTTSFTIPELKERVQTIINLQKEPGDKITEKELTKAEQKASDKDTAKKDKLEGELEKAQEELDDLNIKKTRAEEDVKDKQAEIDATKAAGNAPDKADLDDLKKKQEASKKVGRDAQDKQIELNKKVKELAALEKKLEKEETVYTVIDGKKKIFGSADDILTSDMIRYLSLLPPTSIEIFIKKLETIRTYLNDNNGVSQSKLSKIDNKLTTTKTAVESSIKFLVTPLQYAVLAGNREIVEELIKFNVPMSQRATLTIPTIEDNTQYTLLELVQSRDPKDPNKAGVESLVNDITQARSDAAKDVRKNPPSRNENYGRDQKGVVNEIKNLIYKKLYNELRQGKPEVTIDEVQFEAQIAKGKNDATNGNPPDATLYKPIEWKSGNTQLDGAIVAYTRSYQTTLAAIQGKRDGEAANPTVNPEYSKEEYNAYPERAIKEAYMEAFRVASSTDFDRGYYDGLRGSKFAGYVSSQYDFLEPEYYALVFGIQGSDKRRTEYIIGYEKGLTQLLTPNPTPGGPASITTGYYDVVLANARNAGRYDGSQGKKPYTTPVEYRAADTRLYKPGTPASSRKDTIDVVIKIDQLATNLPDSLFAKETRMDVAIESQKKITKIKEVYDEEYRKAGVSTLVSAGIAAAPSSELKPTTELSPDILAKRAAPPSPPPEAVFTKKRTQELKEEAKSAFKKKGGLTKKYKKKTPKRRTLRRK